MQKITPFLWFDKNAEEAVNYYVSLFKNSKIVAKTHYVDSGPGPKGAVMTVKFLLAGQEFVALNGGPHFTFNEATSFVVNCETQAEIDEMWSRLTAGGSESACGWLKDKFGVSWQVVPALLPELLGNADPAASQRVMAAIMKMKKLDIETLKRAHQGE